MKPDKTPRGGASKSSLRRLASLLGILAAAVLLLLPAAPAETLAAGFAPVRNFTRTTYGSGAQNWAMAQDASGRVYFANRDGMLRFDGARWRLFNLPNYTTVRCILPEDSTGRIYAGGSGTFGYYRSSERHDALDFVSLTGSLPEKERSFSEIWRILRIDARRILFQGDYRLYIYDGSATRAIPSAEKIVASALIGSNVYAAMQNGTLCRLSDNRLLRLRGCEELAGKRVAAILPWDEGSLLIVTDFHGLFTYSAGRLSPLETDISAFLRDNQTFCATASGESYAFGTVNRGAVVKNFATGQTEYINRDTGMQNNTVLGMSFDRADDLWLCLDNGISYAMVHSPVSNLLGVNSEAGAGYAAMLHAGRLLLGTNTGLYSTPYPFPAVSSPPRPDKMLNGQVWNIDSAGGEVLVSTDRGLFRVNPDGSASPVDGLADGCWRAAPLRRHPGYALVSSYKHFHLLHLEEGKWKVLGKVEGFNGASGRFVEDAAGHIWISHWMKGVYRLSIDPARRRFTSVKLYTEADGLPSNRENSLTLHEGRVLIATAAGRFMTPAPDGHLVTDKAVNDRFRLHESTDMHSLPGAGLFAISKAHFLRLSRDAKGEMRLDSTSFRTAREGIIPGFNNITTLRPDLAIVSHEGGFYCLDLKPDTRTDWKATVSVEAVYANTDSLIYLSGPGTSAADLRVPYGLNSLTFDFAMPEFRDENGVLYSFMLENYDKAWSSPSPQASKEYTRLHEGNYTLRLKAYNTMTRQTATAEFRFRVLPPWYRSIPAKIIYVLLVLGAFWLGATAVIESSRKAAQKIRMQKEAEIEAVRKEAEQEALRKDHEITVLKSEQLQQDIKHKSNELSNVTMNVIRKNEILNEISSKLTRLSQKAVDDGNAAIFRDIDKIKTLINENIAHDDDWKNFYQNFDIVYEDFTRRLMEKHPDLTASERRMCCYLKMGLSSKEIAPLFSISTKSVEMNRYRLRRKLNLERDKNLASYLQQL